MAKVTLTVREAIALYKAVEELKGSGVKLSLVKSIDLAMNRKAVEPIVVGWEIATTAPADMQKLQQEEKRAGLKYSAREDAAKLAEELAKITERYASTIAEIETVNATLRTGLDQTHEVELVMIPKTDLKCTEESDKAAAIIFALLPCLS